MPELPLFEPESIPLGEVIPLPDESLSELPEELPPLDEPPVPDPLRFIEPEPEDVPPVLLFFF